MKSWIKTIGFLCFIFILSPSYGQFNLGWQMSALKNTKENVGITGFGIHARIFMGNNFAIGGNFRIWPKKFTEEQQSGLTIKYGNYVADFTGMIEYYFGVKDIRPYIGADAGAYYTGNTLEIRNGSTTQFSQSNEKTFFGIGPKVGLGMDVTSIIGFFAQIQYNLLFGSAGEISNNGFKSKPVDKFWTFDAGAYLRFRPAGKRK